MTVNVYRRDGRVIVANNNGDEVFDFLPSEAIEAASDLRDCAAMARLESPGKTYDHEPQPDDLPEPGDRCKRCGEDITWTGPSIYDWLHVDDEENR